MVTIKLGEPVIHADAWSEYSRVLLGEDHRVVEVVAMPTFVVGKPDQCWAKPPTR
jgi:hypothetical protein